jgi:hypothetical protein
MDFKPGTVNVVPFNGSPLARQSEDLKKCPLVPEVMQFPEEKDLIARPLEGRK